VPLTSEAEITYTSKPPRPETRARDKVAKAVGKKQRSLAKAEIVDNGGLDWMACVERAHESKEEKRETG
jgi:hypothetical protein